MSSKALELTVQIAAWTGGILAAAIGGLLVAVASSDTPSGVSLGLKILVIPLLFALGAAFYLQTHTALLMRDLEIPVAARTGEETKDIEAREKHLDWSRLVLIVAGLVSCLMIGVGVWFAHGAQPPEWKLLGSESSSSGMSYVLGNSGNSQMRLLTSADNGTHWNLCPIEAETASPAPLHCGNASGTLASLNIRLIGNPVVFHSGKHSLRYTVDKKPIDLAPQVCASKQALREQGANGAFVVGSHDRQSVLPGSEVGSNESLARLRAESVAAYISEDNECGSGIGPVIRLNSAPLLVRKELSSAEALAPDRSVAVYGLVANAVQRSR